MIFQYNKLLGGGGRGGGISYEREQKEKKTEARFEMLKLVGLALKQLGAIQTARQ